MPFFDIYFFELLEGVGAAIPQTVFGEALILKVNLPSTVNRLRSSQ